VVRRANELTYDWASTRPEIPDAFVRLASDVQLRALHAAMLPTTHERPKGEYDVDLLLGLAKLDDADNLEEASTLLSNREKLAVLGNRTGFERLCQLMAICHAQEA
jgi:membrane glycosyltransferase